MLKNFILFLLFIIILPLCVECADIYVSTIGSDVTGDGSSGNPYATFTNAYDQSNNDDTIKIRTGQYDIDTNFDLSGSTGIIFEPDTGASVNVSGSANYHFRIFVDNITIDGITFLTGSGNTHNIVANNANNGVVKNCSLKDTLFLFDDCDNWTIELNTIDNPDSGEGSAGILLQNGCDNNLIQNNTVLNSSYWGIQIGGLGGGANPRCDNNIVQNNTVDNVIRHGINTIDSANNIFRNNLVTDAGQFGYHDDTSAPNSNNQWYNNVSIGSGRISKVNGQGMEIEGSDNVKVWNCTFVDSGSNSFAIISNPVPDLTPSTNIQVYNCIMSNGGSGAAGKFEYQLLIEDVTETTLDLQNNCLYDNGLTDLVWDDNTSTGYTISEFNALGIASNNISGDTLLYDTYKILGRSPCVDAGTPVPVNKDYRDMQRPLGKGYDIGAYEYSGINLTGGVTLSGGVTIE